MTQTTELTRRLLLAPSLASIESRADGDNPTLIAGYAAVYFRSDNALTEYRADDDLVERFMPGCFDDFLASDRDCTCSPEHDDSMLLGRRPGGQLLLTSDDKGLRYSVPYDAMDPDHQRVAAKIARGDMTGSSLRFYPHEERWLRDEDTGLIIREMIQVDVLQLGPVSNAAYDGTTAEVRSAAVPDGGWATIQAKKAQFIAAEELGYEALMIEFEQALRI